MKEIQLTQGKVALVDDADYDRVNQHKWRAMRMHDNWYAYTGHQDTENLIELSVFIMGEPSEGMLWDHIDRDGCNNQRSNLRLATRSQNRANSRQYKNNSSGCRGVVYRGYKLRRPWRAQLTAQGKTMLLGDFVTKEEAAIAYDKAAIKYFGPFAQLNFPSLTHTNVLEQL